MRGFPTREQVDEIKERYPIGTVIELTADMEDVYAPIPKGTQGEISSIDDVGTLHMKWSNGRSLGVVAGEDSFKVISKPEEQEMESPKMDGIGGMNL
ncbi:MAG: DUF4314 domain-containing protein [Lachnospiraceae bacterium]|nr:DUF4314 domain-containing protein [Lachnospiraceae bacterium]